jgi:hypothetical protein
MEWHPALWICDICEFLRDNDHSAPRLAHINMAETDKRVRLHQLMIIQNNAFKGNGDTRIHE